MPTEFVVIEALAPRTSHPAHQLGRSQIVDIGFQRVRRLDDDELTPDVISVLDPYAGVRAPADDPDPGEDLPSPRDAVIEWLQQQILDLWGSWRSQWALGGPIDEPRMQTGGIREDGERTEVDEAVAALNLVHLWNLVVTVEEIEYARGVAIGRRHGHREHA